MHPPVFLIGMPGCGKTTLGRALASATGRQLIDLDHYIEGRFSCSVRDIFARYGEERFRRFEQAMLHEVGEMSDVIVACGGGTPCFFDNMDYINSRGISICLSASRDRLIERIVRARHRRPAFADLDRAAIEANIDRLLCQRQPIYAKAHLTLDSTELESRQTIDTAVRHTLALLPTLAPSNS